MEFTRDELLACVRREIAMREKVYPSWVKLGRMSAPGAQRELAMMRAVLGMVEALPVVAPAQEDLFR